MDSSRRHLLKQLSAVATSFGAVPLVADAPHGRTDTRSVQPQRPPAFPFLPYVAKFDVGEFIPKDQGGKFVQMEVFRTEDDVEIVRQIRAGRLTEVYGNPLEWSAFEKTAIEKSVWLNRLYYLPSFARLYYLTRDAQYLVGMMDLLTQWWADNPLTADSARASYNWRDMQVAWRAIHLSWCYYLGREGLSATDRTRIVDSLRQHGDVLLAGFGTQPLSEFNHQSHGSLAMLYLGTLFPSLATATALKTRALDILTHHMTHAFHADGGNVEQMFGYYPFVAHIFRDAYLLCQSAALPLPAGLRPLLERMVDYLTHVTQPNGVLPAVNDSYDMPAMPVLETLRDALDAPPTVASGSRLFPDTQIAVLRSQRGRWYILANPAITIGAHSHAGQLGITLWQGDRPVLVDSGCCTYDDPALVSWYRTARAHNTVLIDGRSDEATSGPLLWVPRRSTGNRIVEWRDAPEYTFCRMMSPASEPTNAGVEWIRRVILVKDRYAVFHDEFIAVGPHRYEMLWHVAAGSAVQHIERRAFAIGVTPTIALIPATSGGVVQRTELIPGLVSVRGVSTPALIAVVEIGGRDHLDVATVAFPARDASKVVVNLERSTGGLDVRVRDEDGRNTGVFIADARTPPAMFRRRRVDGPAVVYDEP